MRRWTAVVLVVLLALGPSAGAAVAAPPAGPDDAARRASELLRSLASGFTVPALAGPGVTASAATADVTALAAPEAPRPGAVGTFAPTPCFTPLPDGVEARCGYVTVPEDHEAPEAGAIQIAVAVLPAAVPEPTADPVVVLAGGPGEKLLAALPLLALPDSPLLGAMPADRDVILLDQRGVGFSVPALECPEAATAPDATAPPDPDDPLAAFRAAVAACRDRLVAGGVDLSAYDTRQNAADLDVVRAALGYPTWNVFGTSYGSKLALEAARQQPDTIRTLTLASPVPLEENFVESVGPSYDQALDRIFAACAAAPACAEQFGDLDARLARAVQRLDAAPVEVTVVIPGTELPITAAITPEVVASALFSLFYVGPAVPLVPAFVDAVARGDYGLLVLLALGFASGGTSLGMQLSVLCAEEAAVTSPEEVLEAAAGTRPLVREHFLPSTPVGLPLFELCEVWDVERADPDLFEPVDTELPSLVMTGRFDQITPPQWGERLAAANPAAVLVEVPDVGHSPLLAIAPCGVELLAAFVAEPSAPLDAGCATERALELLTEPLPESPRGERVAGADRYATAARVALATFPDGADTVVVASGENFPDVLSASGLAGAVGGPVVLTHPDVLSPPAAAALEALGPSTVYVVGGVSAVGGGVSAALAEGYEVVRFDGADRFDTAALMAEALEPAEVGDLDGRRTAIVATGEDFADALTGGPLAYAGVHPVLLVRRDEAPARTLEALAALDIEQVVVLGGAAAVSEAVGARLGEAVGSPVLRVAGASRYETAAQVADLAVGQLGFDGGATLLARGDAFPDAVAGGPHGGAARAPVLLTRPEPLAPATADWYTAQAPATTLVRVLGGPAAVTPPTLAQAVSAITPTADTPSPLVPAA